MYDTVNEKCCIQFNEKCDARKGVQTHGGRRTKVLCYVPRMYDAVKQAVSRSTRSMDARNRRPRSELRTYVT